jgi:hypothetical protein
MHKKLSTWLFIGAAATWAYYKLSSNVNTASPALNSLYNSFVAFDAALPGASMLPGVAPATSWYLLAGGGLALYLKK